MRSSGFLPKSSNLNLRERRKHFETDEKILVDQQQDEVCNDEFHEKLERTAELTSKAQRVGLFQFIESILGPILLTLLSFYLRFGGIDKNSDVVWDEAHFGKFGSYYIKHEFYHDVHPPLGKMLIGLSEFLAGFDGDFAFDSGSSYPDGLNFKFMRQFNATFGALCVPIVYFTAKEMGFSLLTTYLVSLMVALEHSYIALSKFILLDSILLFFTLTTFYCLVKVHNLRKRQLTRKWSLWMLLTGFSIGCVCSVKWVGLFVTMVVGFYTLIDIFSHHCNKEMKRLKYYRHWVIRVLNLILIPFMVYLFCFKIHFTLLYKSGTGDASTNTLFQVNLEGTKIAPSPRDVVYGSEVTIRSHGLSPNLLHSHVQKYPEGSRQRQVTGYGHSDNNNNWVFKTSRFSDLGLDENGLLDGEPVMIKDGTEVRLLHKNMGSNLHTHEIASHVSKGNFEVSGYGSDDSGDEKDDWIVEIVEQLDSANPNFSKEDPQILHPLSTSFRLRNKVMGCYLASTGLSYPTWGFKQAEIVCKSSWSKRDKSTWWNIEDHWNSNLEIPEDYVPPKSKFWADFVLINFAMASSNNALVPDEDKYDNLASKAWEWPTLHVGLRMCGWSSRVVRYFLLGSPFNTWISTLSLFAFILIVLSLAYKWRRQSISFTEDELWTLAMQGGFPFISWAFHYLPFVFMGRVTYVHHYVPALYFAILVFGFVVDYTLTNTKSFVKYSVYFALFFGCTYIYILFAPIAQGLEGPGTNYRHLQWLPTWKIV